MTPPNGNPPFDTWMSSLPPGGRGGHFFGVYVGLVIDEQDPDGLGRVQVELPWTTDPDGNAYAVWARLATMMAGNNRGTWFIPEPGDEVLVSFLGGDPRHPVVTGAMWNGQDIPPETMDSNNNIRSITSRSGITITFDDSDGAVRFTIETPGGQRIRCEDTPASISMSDSNGNQLTMDASGITINTPAKFTVSAGAMAEISTGLVSVNSGMSTFSGVVQSQTNITNTTVSATYTPGAGNIW